MVEQAGIKLVAQTAEFDAALTKSGQVLDQFGQQLEKTTGEINTGFQKMARSVVTVPTGMITELTGLSNRAQAIMETVRMMKIPAPELDVAGWNQVAERMAGAYSISAAGAEQFRQDFTVIANQVVADQKRIADEAEETAKKLEKSMTQVGLALGAVGAAGMSATAEFAFFASRVEEVGLLLEVTRQNAVKAAEAEGDMAKAAGLNADAVQQQIEGIKALHLSTLVATETVAQLIRYQLDFTKATELAREAQDAATYANQDSSQALEGLIHGITTLQPRILRTYGIMVNLNQAYREYARANNLVATELTQLERQQAALTAVLEQADRITGAYEASMQTASKQFRSLNTDIMDLEEAFGEHLTPALDVAVGGLRSLIHGLTDLPDPIQAFVSTATASGSALATIASAALLLQPRLPALKMAFTNLASSVGLSTTAMLGLGAAIPVAIGVVAALIEADKARRQEAATLAITIETYPEYIRALEIAEEKSYILTEQLWEQVQAQKAANQEAYAARILEEQRDMYTRLDQAVRRFGGSLDKALEAWIAGLPYLNEFQLALMADEEAMYNMAIQLGASEEKAREWANAVSLMARAETDHREQTEELIERRDELAEVRQRMIDGSDDEAAAMTRLTTVVDTYSDAVKEATNAELAWWTLRGQYAADYAALEEFERQRTEEVQKAAEKIVAAEQKAADGRKQANLQLQDALEDLEIDHANKVADIYDDIAKVDKELQKKLVESNERRIELQIDLEQKLEDIRIELARRQEDIEREHLQDLEDLEREYGQKRGDAARELAQDMEDMEREHQERLEDIRTERQESLLELEEEYQRRLWEIENAGLLALQKLRDEYAEKDSDARLAAARKALELAEQMGIGLSDEMRQAIIDMFRTGGGPEDLLDLLPQDLALIFRDLLEELKGLNDDLFWDQLDLSDDIQKDQERRKEDLQKWLADEQAAIEEAYQKRLEEEQRRIEEERAEREREYADKLDDLRRAQDREREEIERDRQRKLEDLQLWNQRERDEAQRNYQQRLEDLERQLALEKERLEQAAEEERQRLRDRLQDEQENYNQRADELNRQYERRLRDIADNEKAERDEIQMNLDLKLKEYEDGYDDISFAARVGMEQMINDARLLLPDLVEEHRKTIREIQQAWADAGMTGHSPAPWWKAMAESWGEGIQIGFDEAAMRANVQSVIGDLQSQIAGALPYQMASVPGGIGGSTINRTSNSTLNVTANYQHQGGGGLADDLSLWHMMMKARGRL